MNCKPTPSRFFPLARLTAALLLGLLVLAAEARGLTAAEEEIESRLARIEEMSDAEKADLLKNQERFNQLTPQEREKLRTLEVKLEESSDRERLEAVMQQYSQWLSTLTTGQRAELRSLPRDERIERIRVLLLSLIHI